MIIKLESLPGLMGPPQDSLRDSEDSMSYEKVNSTP